MLKVLNRCLVSSTYVLYCFDDAKSVNGIIVVKSLKAIETNIIYFRFKRYRKEKVAEIEWM